MICVTADGRRHVSDDVIARDSAEGIALPACDDLADALARIGRSPAKAALLRALKARRHHIRSAAVKALATIGVPDALAAIQSLANDSSYEVRQDVAEALQRFQPKAQHRERHQRG